MGVHGLWKLLEPVGRRVDIATLRNKILAVDASIWLTAFVKAMRTPDGEVMPNAHLLGTFRRVLRLLMHRIQPIFVFDGGVPTLKKRTILRRQERRAAQESKHSNIARRILLRIAKERSEGDRSSERVSTPPKFESRSTQIGTAGVASVGAAVCVDDGESSAPEIEITSAPKRRRLRKFGENPCPTENTKSYVAPLRESLGSDPSSSDDDNDDGMAPALPDHTEAIDIDAIASLPPLMQKEFVEEIRRKRKLEARSRLTPIAADPAAFSQAQLAGFLNMAKFNQQVDEVNLKQARASTGRKIASEPDREYMLIVDHQVRSGADTESVALSGALGHYEPAEASDRQKALLFLSSKRAAYQRDGRGRGRGRGRASSFQYVLNDIDTSKRPKPGVMATSYDKLHANPSTLSELMPVGVKPVFATQLEASVAAMPEDRSLSQRDGESETRGAASSDGLALVTSTSAEMGPTSSDHEVLVESDHSDESDAGGFCREGQEGDLPAAKPRRSSPTVWDIYSSKDQVAVKPAVSAHVVVEDNSDAQSDASWDTVERSVEPQSPHAVVISPAEVEHAAVFPSASFAGPNPTSADLTIHDATAGGLAVIAGSDSDADAEAIASDSEGEAPAPDWVEYASDYEAGIQPSTLPRSSMHAYTEDAGHRLQPALTGSLAAGDTPHVSPASERTSVALSAARMADLSKEDEVAMRKAARDSDTVTDVMREEVIALLQLFGLPYIIAPMEAEAQCAQLESQSMVDGVITDDSDAFLFGARNVYRNIFDDKKYVEVYMMDDIEKELGFQRDDLVRSALLLGSDYTEGISGVGPVNAAEILSAFPGDEGLQDFRDMLRGVPTTTHDLPHEIAQRRKNFISKHKAAARQWQVSDGFPGANVLAAYRQPTVVSLSKATHQFDVEPPNFASLRLLCEDRFGWQPDKVERELGGVQRELSQFKAQQTLDSFLTYNDQSRAAKIKSTRLQAAVEALSGKRVDDMVATST